MKKGFTTVLLSVLLSMLAAYGVLKAATVNGSDKVSSPVTNSITKTVNLAQSDYPDLTYAAEAAVEAVVYVEVTATQQYQIDDPFYRFFFGESAPQSRQVQGSGSGVIIRPDGYIVTNNHVVANATKISVTLNNNKTYEATVIGTDPATDIALIKIDADGLHVRRYPSRSSPSSRQTLRSIPETPEEPLSTRPENSSVSTLQSFPRPDPIQDIHLLSLSTSSRRSLATLSISVL